MVDALDLWRKIAAWPGSIEAVKFYEALDVSKDPDFFSEGVLRRGAANFDVRVTEEFKCAAEVIDKEELHYRIACYASKKGYMDMHIKQSRVAFKKYLKGIEENEKSILFVDYGCGPMTSGLALAEVLPQSCGMTDDKKRVTYHGIDVSEQVVKFAKCVNSGCSVFNPDCFSVVQADDLCLSNVPECSPQIAILCLSFVLAPGTFKMGKRAAGQQDAEKGKQDAEKLAEQWNNFVQTLPECRETRIIYINPRPGCTNPHKNWYPFKSAMKKFSNRRQGVVYSDSGSGMDLCEWDKPRAGQKEPRTCHMAMIKVETETTRRRQ